VASGVSSVGKFPLAPAVGIHDPHGIGFLWFVIRWGLAAVSDLYNTAERIIVMRSFYSRPERTMYGRKLLCPLADY
jgi:hypothetical protein